MKIESFSCDAKVDMILVLRQDDMSTFKYKNDTISRVCSEEYVQRRLKKAITMITDHVVPIHLYLDSDDYFMIASPEDYVRLRAVQEILRTPMIESIAVSVIIFPDRKSFSNYIDNEHILYIESAYVESDCDNEDD